MSSQVSHYTPMLHSTGLPCSTNGMGSNVKSSPRVWIALILSVATFFLLCFNSDPSVGTIPYACNSLMTSTPSIWVYWFARVIVYKIVYIMCVVADKSNRFQSARIGGPHPPMGNPGSALGICTFKLIGVTNLRFCLISEQSKLLTSRNSYVQLLYAHVSVFSSENFQYNHFPDIFSFRS